MRRSLKRAWIEDLRANPDKQGRHFLTRRDPVTKVETDCCLGRLCKLIHAPVYMIETNGAVNGDDVTHYGRSGVSSASLPTADILDSAGIHDELDLLKSEFHTALRDREDQVVRLSGLNDQEDKYMTFDRIADMVDHFIDEEEG